MTKQQSLELKGIAILCMFLLHLFNTYNYQDIYSPFLYIKEVTLTFYISLYADICVAIFLFISGYGLYSKYCKTDENQYVKSVLPGIKSLLINYWVILVLFCLIIAPLLGDSDRYPNNMTTFLLNALAIDTSYCGAWWFLTTYILLALSSKWIFTVVDKCRPFILLLAVITIYTLGYIQRFKSIIDLQHPVLNWFVTESALYANSLLPFALGAFFVKYNIFNYIDTYVKQVINGWKLKIVILFALTCLFVAKMHLPSLYFAGGFFIATIMLYLIWSPIGIFAGCLNYLGQHSTNLWLTHMFIYLQLSQFKPYVYWSDNPLLILASLLGICLLFSYLINKIKDL